MAERTFEYRERLPEDLMERRRAQLDELYEQARGHLDELYEQARGHVEDPYETLRARKREKMEHGRHARDEIEEQARGRAAELTDRMRDTMGYARERTGELGERVRGVPEYVGERVRDAAGYTRDKVEDAAGYTRDRVGGATGYAREKLVMRMSERVTLQDTHFRAWKSSVRMHANVFKNWASTLERVKETVSGVRDRAEDNWHKNTEATKHLGEKEYCMPLPTDRLCARHVVWFVPIILVAALYFFRRRNPERWKAGMKKLSAKKELLETKMMSARDQAMETLRDEHAKVGHRISETEKELKHRGAHASKEAGHHVMNAGQAVKRAGDESEGKKNV
ncbi:hypothetical protein ATCC90586_003786 [Pythium insidiosum]|nr:hypothetical protein ATCC90586_003786 [Pythium insidiosum]